jgi:regulation of enolase protein 1 (concanavalin A-like superfamily)
MIRESLNAAAAQASMFVTPGKGLAYQRRLTTGAASLNTQVTGAAPRWVRLTRAGQTITASVSTDGSSWSDVGTDTVSVSSDAWVGLAVASHDSSRTATATFDHVAIVGG